MDNALTTAGFADFFRALWGHDPFPWQQCLLERVVGRGWPHTLDLPTGAGKTSVLDVAIYALALDARRPPTERTQPRRIGLVIDRRVIVDQAYERARAISDGVGAAADGILAAVGAALRGLHSGLGSEQPMGAAILRGGMVRDNDWARSPDLPLLLVSTVDQIGSRLLFRGYGVSDGMAPVHAGLLGRDTLFLLDEVHLSRPFEETLAALSSYADSPLVERPAGRTMNVVRMSATVGGRVDDAFGLDEADRAHPVLGRRLSVAKQVTLGDLVAVPSNEEKARRKIAQACVQHARDLFSASDVCEVAAIIVNRVGTAREAAALAAEAKWARELDVDVVLITGRMRPLDRQRIERDVVERVGAGRVRPSGRRTLLVSTQAIEAGADFDFDALITELSSLDSLRQRFGRLDRRGEMEGAARGVIVAADRSVGGDAEDPIYGTALSATWAYLREVSEGDSVDFGISAQTALGPPAPELLAPSLSAPALLPAYLDAWVQTKPKPAMEPDLSVFLHGPERGSPDVQIVWRADLSAELLDRGLSREAAKTLLAACPPSSLEALSVPIWAARSWLAAVAERAAGAKVGAMFGVADVEGDAPPSLTDAAREAEAQRTMAPVLLWLGEDTRVTSDPRDIRPGLTLVVPSTYAGLSAGNWDPTSSQWVVDIGDEAQLVHRGRATIRWNESVLRGWLGEGATGPAITDEAVAELGPRAVTDAFERWAEEIEASDAPRWARLSLRVLRREKSRIVDGPPDANGQPSWRATIARRRLAPKELRELERPAEEPAAASWTEDEGSSFTGTAVGLARHLGGVRDIARRFATALGLSDALCSDLALAGWLHDLGKADARFQLMLHGGDEIRAVMASEPLAKSALPAHDRVARERARQRAGYPGGQRHELLSVALVESTSAFREQAEDWDLVLHLVASHHGYCRPFAPVEWDEAPLSVAITHDGVDMAAASASGLARFDSGVGERFWRLVHRYGWHGLAFLEATLRLADHRESELETGSGEER